MLNHGVISWEPYKGIHATMAALVATSAASTVTANRYIRKTALSMAMWLDVLRRPQQAHPIENDRQTGTHVGQNRDRKSTRLNSSHSQISYAVFCLKKKKTQM